MVVRDVEVFEGGFRDFDALRIVLLIKGADDLEARVGFCSGNQLDDDVMAEKRLAAPINANEREHAVFDTVPLASAGRMVSDRNSQIYFVREFLKFGFPETDTSAVGAAAIGGDQQGFGFGVAGLAHSLPPATNAFDGKGRRIMADADTHPAFIGRNVIDPIGRHLPFVLDHKIMNPDLLGIALGP